MITPSVDDHFNGFMIMFSSMWHLYRALCRRFFLAASVQRALAYPGESRRGFSHILTFVIPAAFESDALILVTVPAASILAKFHHPAGPVQPSRSTS